MKKHTTLNLDMELLRAAEEALGTSGATETVHRALREAVNAQMRRWLAESDMSWLTLENVEAMRQPRAAVVELEDRQPAKAAELADTSAWTQKDNRQIRGWFQAALAAGDLAICEMEVIAGVTGQATRWLVPRGSLG